MDQTVYAGMTNTGPCTNSDITFEYKNAGVEDLKLLSDAEFSMYIALPPKERGIFDVALCEYPTQPWNRPAQALMDNRAPIDVQHMLLGNLSQWFNYRFTPTTFASYAARQRQVLDAIQARTTAAVPTGLPTHSGTQQRLQK